MSQHENRVCDLPSSDWAGGNTAPEDQDIVHLPSARLRAMEQAGAMLARELNGPLTALLLYMGEIRHHSLQPSHADGDRDHLRRVADNALQQTERICALVQRIGGAHAMAAAASGRSGAWDGRAVRTRSSHRAVAAVPLADARQKSLTKREREVLNLISEGCSNKQGALRMRISPRTFESHRAEAMRKLGARNTADLVRAALLHPGD